MGYNLLILRWHGDRVGTGCEFSFCDGLGERLFASVSDGAMDISHRYILCRLHSPNEDLCGQNRLALALLHSLQHMYTYYDLHLISLRQRVTLDAI